MSRSELQDYWKLIRDLPGPKAALLRLHLLTGGQRIEQLIRLRRSDVEEDAITIFDLKGRPGQGPRAHRIPLIEPAREALSVLKAEGEFAISTTGGKKPISAGTMAGWAREILAEGLPGFQLKRVRSGVETLLAANRVSRDLRGHLQSHGLAGVQMRHYDGHDYLPEMRASLELLFQLLEPEIQSKTTVATPA